MPDVQPWELLVKMSVSGVCGSDISFAAGHLGPHVDVLGHEGVGRIVKLGSGVNPELAQINDRVGIAWVRDACGRCQSCRLPGGEKRCLERLNSARTIQGTFAEYCTVPSRYLLKLPDELGLEDEVIAPILCGGITAYGAVKTCALTPGEWVLVSGAGGGVGSFGVQYARAMGYRAIAVDLGVAKKDFCLSLGAEAYLDALDPMIETMVLQVTGGNKAKAVIVTAGSGAAYQQALKLVAPCGTICCVGIPPPDGTFAIHPLQCIDLGIRVIGSAVGTRSETLDALEFVRRGLVKPLVHHITLDGLNDIAKKVATVSSTAFGKYEADRL
jgi:alcohol dehydrogenase, propanol-preferring